MSLHISCARRTSRNKSNIGGILISLAKCERPPLSAHVILSATRNLRGAVCRLRPVETQVPPLRIHRLDQRQLSAYGPSRTDLSPFWSTGAEVDYAARNIG